ncbi:NmrA family NAD(P)-binding protein [Pedobacter sp. HMF7647]|uniref:NmrA family NAD(P)-binding protein n=1 Tax=Hufsiella arboris TaxID=2695275 RepID=A0A7K1YDN8_9SPHI|nr:NmrA family NAD(P)-binding protein [Hufsiella arboris]MXV52716.1 NmrA family NAD(P)-binding protein [Hufsiella arboris]
MRRILITGATGNVGRAILSNIAHNEADLQVFSATRIKESKADQLYFNFDDIEGSKHTLKQIDILFLLRPPQLADVPKYFKPLIENCIEVGVSHIIFLSVQGAENTPYIPHAKIEKLIVESEIPYTFIRPSYFMQNLTTMFLQDIRNKHRIFIPAGKAKFLWVDVNDIGKAISKVIQHPKQHQFKAYTITGNDLKSFQEVADLLSRTTGMNISYQSPNLINFFLTKRKEGIKTSFIIVMIVLHYLPRFQKAPPVTNDFTQLTAEAPLTLKKFIEQEKATWIS